MTHHRAAFVEAGGDAAWLEAVVSGRFEHLPDRVASVCSYALKLTFTPARVTSSDIEVMRVAGLCDRDIVDVNQVAAYFNYVNRIAHGLGVELEEYWPEEARAIRHYPLAE